jgi:hypothetical protein
MEGVGEAHRYSIDSNQELSNDLSVDWFKQNNALKTIVIREYVTLQQATIDLYFCIYGTRIERSRLEMSIN